ncbi:MAG TPA: DUF5615 family PIN-like protein [Chloroflexota bacterium]
MAGLGLRLFTDEMIPWRLAAALRQRGYDVLSCEEAGRANQQISDEDQLVFATQNGRAILSFNARDFVPLDAGWKATGRRHAGIILLAQVAAFGTLLRYVARHLDSVPPAVQEDLLIWLDTSPLP